MSKVKIPRKNSTTTKILAAIGLKHFAMDADPEDIADVVDEMASENQSTDSENEANEKKEAQTDNETKECTDNENKEIAEIKSQIAQLTEFVKGLVQHKDEAPEDAIDELINELNTSDSEENSETIEMDEDIPSGEISNQEDRPKNPISNADSAAIVTALKTIKPFVAKISDANERKKACDSLVAEFKKVKKSSNKSNGYANIVEAQRKAANDAMNKKSAADKIANYNENLGEEIAKKYNANLKGGN